MACYVPTTILSLSFLVYIREMVMRVSIGHTLQLRPLLICYWHYVSDGEQLDPISAVRHFLWPFVFSANQCIFVFMCRQDPSVNHSYWINTYGVPLLRLFSVSSRLDHTSSLVGGQKPPGLSVSLYQRLNYLYLLRPYPSAMSDDTLCLDCFLCWCYLSLLLDRMRFYSSLAM